MVTDHDISSKYADSFQKAVSEWLRNGKISYYESMSYGIDTSIDSFLGMFSGANIGKTIVKVPPHPSPPISTSDANKKPIQSFPIQLVATRQMICVLTRLGQGKT